MEDLIRQAFLHVEVIGPHVADGHYDLVGPTGDIILPQVWETVVEPDWTITMHMWPMPEPPPPVEVPPDAGGAVVVVPDPPPNPGLPPFNLHKSTAPTTPICRFFLFRYLPPSGANVTNVTDIQAGTKKIKKPSGLSAWMAGGKPKPKPKPKISKKA